MRGIEKLLIVLFFVSVFSCKKESAAPAAPLTAMELKDVAYGTDALQKMDVSLPAGRNTTDTKVLVLIHGGSWISGDKSEFTGIVDALKAQFPDYAILNINYRLANLAGGNIWPAQLNDVNAALTYLQTNAATYAVNTNKIAVFGASAGAQLALLKAYRDNADNSIKVVVDLFGPTDLIDMYNQPTDPTYPALLNVFLKGTPITNNAGYVSASPLFFVSNKVPPTIIFHGTADNIVHIRQSDSLNLRLTNAGVLHEYTRYTNEGHGWAGSNLLDTYAKAIAFVKKVMP